MQAFRCEWTIGCIPRNTDSWKIPENGTHFHILRPRLYSGPVGPYTKPSRVLRDFIWVFPSPQGPPKWKWKCTPSCWWQRLPAVNETVDSWLTFTISIRFGPWQFHPISGGLLCILTVTEHWLDGLLMTSKDICFTSSHSPRRGSPISMKNTLPGESYVVVY